MSIVLKGGVVRRIVGRSGMHGFQGLERLLSVTLNVYTRSAEMAMFTEVIKLAGRKELARGNITKLLASLQTNLQNLECECDYWDVEEHRTVINITVNHEFKLWCVKV